MNVYDFDKTIYRGDSTRRFLMFLIRRHPALLLRVPAFAVNALLFGLGALPKQEFKSRMFRAFFGHVADVPGELDIFWASEHERIYAWYAAKHRDDDIVISASPEALVRPCCEMLGISRVMGSPVDLMTGEYYGRNCHGDEKVRRFREAFPDAEIENFFSDSHSDDPMARVARRAFMVSGEMLTPWTFKK